MGSGPNLNFLDIYEVGSITEAYGSDFTKLGQVMGAGGGVGDWGWVGVGTVTKKVQERYYMQGIG